MQKQSAITCALVSGGLDSAVLVHRLLTSRPGVLPLYMRCGMSWESVELTWLRRFLRAIQAPRLLPLRCLDVPLQSTYGAHWSLTGRHIPGARSSDEAVYLPGRNVLLIAHAAIVCAQEGISEIALGLLSGNPFGDASSSFLRRFAACLTEALRSPIRVSALLRRSTKSQLIRAASALPLHLTFSCLSPRGQRHCGRCNKCAERRQAFREAGISDPTRYASYAVLRNA